ncbi:MAG: hypothetical protein AB1422_06015 [bacterium]
MNIFKKIMAVGCRVCPLCWYARKHPKNWLGRLMQWHGKWCPVWNAHEEFYGEKRD